MNIRFGFDLALDFPAPTPLVLLLHTRPEYTSQLRLPQVLQTTPVVTPRLFTDSFGNTSTRLRAPAGTLRLSIDSICEVSHEPDPVRPDAALHDVNDLPEEALRYLVSSRFCETERLVSFAWSRFGHIASGWERVQAICDYVHNHLRFDYAQARPTRTAFEAWQEGVAVCRDFAHLGITLCRCLNIPARYATGYLGDIGVPPDPAPMDFSAWFEVYLGSEWHTFDPRHNTRRIGRIVMARGRDAVDCALVTSFGRHELRMFKVITEEMTSSVTEAARERVVA